MIESLLYWRIGRRIHHEVLGSERAAYSEQIVVTLSRQLVMDYGRGYSEKNLRRMVQFADAFSEEEIVVTLSRQLSWSHFAIERMVAAIARHDFVAARRHSYEEMRLRLAIEDLQGTPVAPLKFA